MKRVSSSDQKCVLLRELSIVLFAVSDGDNNTTIISFYFRLTALGKNLEHVQNAKSDSNPIECIIAGLM